DHGTDGLGALNMTVIVNLDAVGQFGELEELGHFAQRPRLRAGFGEPSVEGFGGVTLGLLHETATVSALRNADLDAMSDRFAQRQFEELTLGQLSIDQDRAWWGHFLVELGQHAREYL